MGQQQLLLLVLGIVIVAIAVMAGIFAFKTGIRQSAADHIVDRNLTIASHAVFWKTKSDPYNGGSASYAGLATDGMATLSLDEESAASTFRITAATANSIEITGVSNRFPEIGVRTYVNGYSVDTTFVRYDGTFTLN